VSKARETVVALVIVVVACILVARCAMGCTPSPEAKAVAADEASRVGDSHREDSVLVHQVHAADDAREAAQDLAYRHRRQRLIAVVSAFASAGVRLETREASMIELLAAVLRLVAEALNGRKTDEEVAKELLAAAFETGIPASILMDHLTEVGRMNAETAADIAQWLKVQGRP